MQDLESVFGALSQMPWLSAMAAAAAAVVLLLVFSRERTRGVVVSLTQFAAFLIGLFVAWNYFDRQTIHERTEERRALEQRMAELTARAVAPGSALACLDGAAGMAVEDACEKALFANPETVAAAVSYVSARLTLLADGIDFANRGDSSYELALVGTRRAVEIDRFGIVAHILATRDNCTAEQCDAFSLLRDSSRVVSNLREKAFDVNVGRHVAEWLTRSGNPPVASNAPPQLAGSPAPAGQATNAEFPTASSIPPVSIMVNEPGMSGQTGMPEAKPAQPPAARASAKPPAKRSAQDAAAKPAQAAAPAPPAANAETAPRVQ